MHPNANRVLLGDAVHNIGDGILLVPAFIVSLELGLATAFAVLLHEFVQEISEFFVLKESGYSTRRALLFNFAVSSTILIGIVLSLLISSLGTLASLLVGFAGGGFAYIILRDLLPHTLQSVRCHGNADVHLTAVVLGVAIMFASVNILPHSHEHESSPLNISAVEPDPFL